MIVRLAVRSLGVRRLRTAVLACGFGLGIAVMAVLLGVGEVVLEQAHAPALQGGGDLVVQDAYGLIDSARFVLSNIVGAGALAKQVAVAAPSRRALVYLIRPGDTAVPVIARGGIPSLEKALDDPEVIAQTGWSDAPSDGRWTRPDPGDVLRAMDRFHGIPDAPEFADSWAEWLYFNGRSADGRVRYYLTFLAGPARQQGVRAGGVRLQLERDGRQESYAAGADLDEAALLASAPEISIGDSGIRLDGTTYRIHLRLRSQRTPSTWLTGDLSLAATPGRSVPPAAMRGARRWVSGYVVPVLSGRVDGSFVVGGERLVLENATGYHDHNWGFWRDVRWQWGQVASDDLSFVYGRVFPPPTVADPDRMPGFLGVVGPDGPLGVATNVSIVEHGGGAVPDVISIAARGPAVDLRLEFRPDRQIQTPLAMTQPSAGGAIDFLQLGGSYQVSGTAAGRRIDFTAKGAAETFRKKK